MLLNKIQTIANSLLKVGYITTTNQPAMVLTSFKGVSYFSSHSPFIQTPFRYRVKPEDKLYKGIYDVEGPFILENITSVKASRLYVTSNYREAKIKEETLSLEPAYLDLDEYISAWSKYSLKDDRYFFAVPVPKAFLEKGLEIQEIEEDKTLRFSFPIASRKKHLSFSEYNKKTQVVYTNTPHVLENIFKYFIEQEVEIILPREEYVKTAYKEVDKMAVEQFKTYCEEILSLKNKLEALYKSHND